MSVQKKEEDKEKEKTLYGKQQQQQHRQQHQHKFVCIKYFICTSESLCFSYNPLLNIFCRVPPIGMLSIETIRDLKDKEHLLFSYEK